MFKVDDRVEVKFGAIGENETIVGGHARGTNREEHWREGVVEGFANGGAIVRVRIGKLPSFTCDVAHVRPLEKKEAQK